MDQTYDSAMILTYDDIMHELAQIDDPEMPISIVDLGIVEDVAIDEDRHSVEVTILPTFVGCPALDMIRDDIVKRLGALEDISRVSVNFVHNPPWSPDRISENGRAQLREHGVTVPALHQPQSPHIQLTTSAVTERVACPFCESKSTHLDSPFGPTRCRTIYYCEACRNSFEHMKRVG